MKKDFSLFPKMEEWGSGDEALDVKLHHALKTATLDLSSDSIKSFYDYAINLKLRVSNPSYRHNVIYVTKALLYSLTPESFINNELIKLRSGYFNKNKINFDFSKKDILKESLLISSHYRYKDQLDFYLKAISESGRNPFLKDKILNSQYELHTKTIFKDTMAFLVGEKTTKSESDYQDELLLLLKKEEIIVIDEVCELWINEGIIESIALF